MLKQQIKDIIRALSEYEILFEKYIIGNSPEIISAKDIRLLNIQGYEYVVFKYKDKILKIHRKNYTDVNSMDEKNMQSLMGIKTKRILLPSDILYNVDGRTAGYLMEYIEGEKSISDETIDHFLTEAYELLKDKEILDKQRILLQDLHPGNAIYNGKIYIVDSGRFINTKVMLPTYMHFMEDMEIQRFKPEDISSLSDKIKETNMCQLNYFLYRFIMKDIYSYNSAEGCIYLRLISDYLKARSKELKTSNYIDVIEKEASKDMTVGEFAKRLKKCIDNKYN